MAFTTQAGPDVAAEINIVPLVDGSGSTHHLHADSSIIQSGIEINVPPARSGTHQQRLVVSINRARRLCGYAGGILMNGRMLRQKLGPRGHDLSSCR
jgi:biopolymer transport protein ExbD